MQDELKVNPSRFCSFYRATTKTARIPKTVHLGSDVVSSPFSKATMFNTFFASVFHDCDHQTITNGDDLPTSDELHLIQVSIEDVLCILKTINPSKASGPA
jgi:hypothetical protein